MDLQRTTGWASSPALYSETAVAIKVQFTPSLKQSVRRRGLICFALWIFLPPAERLDPWSWKNVAPARGRAGLQPGVCGFSPTLSSRAEPDDEPANHPALLLSITRLTNSPHLDKSRPVPLQATRPPFSAIRGARGRYVLPATRQRLSPVSI